MLNAGRPFGISPIKGTSNLSKTAPTETSNKATKEPGTALVIFGTIKRTNLVYTNKLELECACRCIKNKCDTELTDTVLSANEKELLQLFKREAIQLASYRGITL